MNTKKINPGINFNFGNYIIPASLILRETYVKFWNNKCNQWHSRSFDNFLDCFWFRYAQFYQADFVYLNITNSITVTSDFYQHGLFCNFYYEYSY